MALTLKNPVYFGVYLFEYDDPNGDGWSGFTTLALGNYDAKKKTGDWALLDDNWTNLLAWDRTGKFKRTAPFTWYAQQTKGIKHELLLWDYNTSKEYPSFVLSQAPTTPYEMYKASGHGDIFMPRNSCGTDCFINWAQTDKYA